MLFKQALPPIERNDTKHHSPLQMMIDAGHAFATKAAGLQDIERLPASTGVAAPAVGDALANASVSACRAAQRSPSSVCVDTAAAFLAAFFCASSTY